MKKFNKKYFQYNFLKRLLVIVVFYFWVLLDSYDEILKESKPDQILMFTFILVTTILYAIGLIIYEILLYRMSGYEITDSGIHAKSGVFFKKNSVLTYDKMHAINERQGIIQKLFKIEALYIDSGSTNTGKTAEIVIYETKEEITKIMKLIDDKKNNRNLDESLDVKEESINKEDELVFSLTNKEKGLYVCVKTIQSLIIFLILSILSSIGMTIVSLSYSSFIGFIFGGGIALSAFSGIVYVVTSFINLYDFKVYKNDEEIKVNYGLFVKYNNRLPLNRIKAIRIKSTLFDRILGYVRVKIDVVGFVSLDSSENVSGYLIPYIKKNRLNEYLEKLVPNYIPTEELEYKSKGIFPRISVSLLINTILMFLLLGFIGIVWLIMPDIKEEYFIVSTLTVITIYLISILVLYFLAFLAHKNEGITIEDNRLILVSGGFTKTISIISRENVIGINDITTYLRNKKGITSYHIHIHSNSLGNVILVNIMDDKIKEKLYSFLKISKIN